MAMRNRYPFGYTDEDLDALRNELWTGFNTYRGPLLPTGGFAERLLPGLLGEFRVDVREQDDEILVVADLPGIEKQDVNLKLVNPKTLEISTERKSETEEEEKGYFVRERVYGSMKRILPLPHEVTDKGAKATFTNGVLEVKFKKINIEKSTRIKIE